MPSLSCYWTGLTGPSSIAFSPRSRYLTFLSSARRQDRQFCVCETSNLAEVRALLKPPATLQGEDSLEEKLRRERQRLHGGSITQFTMILTQSHSQRAPPSHPNPTQQQKQTQQQNEELRLLIPIRGSLYIQNGIHGQMYSIYDKSRHIPSQTQKTGSVIGRDRGAIDAQLSPDGKMVAFVVAGDIYVVPTQKTNTTPTRITYGARQDNHVCVSHGLADFVAQEEMDRYRGFWWDPQSQGILFAKVDESHVPAYRITHQGQGGEDTFEDHRYPFAGKLNPKVQLGYVKIDATSITEDDPMQEVVAKEAWSSVKWLPAPREAQEYLARVSWLPDGTACAQWQNRVQATLVLTRINLQTEKCRTLLVERSDVWINLHHMLKVLPRAIHPDECPDAVERLCPPGPLPEGSFSFIFASERTGFTHLYLYTFVPGLNNERAILVRSLSGGDWMVESIVGIDMAADALYVTGTYDSALERHLYALPILSCSEESSNGDSNMNGGVRRSLKNVMNAFAGATSNKPRIREDGHPIPVRLTADRGMHNLVMDDACRMFVDTSSDLGRPTSVKIYQLPEGGPFSLTSKGRKMPRSCEDVKLLATLYDAAVEDKSLQDGNAQLTPPELLSFPTTDGTETLHAALYRPDPRVHGMGPYPLICAVYGGPHVQRVNRSWSQCCDMRAQRLRSLGFAVIKCDNRGSSRRGLSFEGAIKQRLGRLEVLDQVATVRHLSLRGIADASRVGIYGWSYGGYLSAMCLCRAPDVFHVAVAGAPVTSWDGYDTHYTERYMGLPSENPSGYRESSILDHVPSMRGKLMMVHGLIDENVHFRHTARLINRLISAGKDYDLLIFPDERHSPRKLRDRIYMEQRISDYFLQHLGRPRPNMAGHL